MTGLVEVWAGDSLLAFDGRVLEVFGFPGKESARFHVRNLHVEIGAPSRKERRMVTLRPATKAAGGCAFEVEGQDWTAVGPFLERVVEATDDGR